VEESRSFNGHRRLEPIRVVFAIGGLVVGGAERLVIEMANHFAEIGWISQVLCLDQAGIMSDDLSKKVLLTVLKKKSGYDFSLIMKIRRFVDHYKPDVINSHLWTANTWMRAALIDKKVPIVITEHNRDVWKSSTKKMIDRLLQYRAAQLIAVSEDTADFYRIEVGVHPSRILIINNGIDLTKYSSGVRQDLHTELNIKRNRKLLIQVGRLVEQKNHYRFLDAIKILQQTNQNFCGLIVGDGPLRADLECYANQHDLMEFVRFMGTRKDIPNLLTSADIFTLSSDREGHPLTAMEAQAAGIPVVLTDVGGAKLAIGRKGNQSGGILVEPNAQQLAMAWKTLLDDDSNRLAMGQFAREFALSHFGIDSMFCKYKELFENVLL
jgi:glycosyltransferase involved in cell wall biosynthesis